jgi:hypothetical protein
MEETAMDKSSGNQSPILTLIKFSAANPKR